MIRLTRQAIGMSQETLCEDICSVQTLSRIENGKTNVKKDIYRMLMERMGRNEEKINSILRVEDFDIWELFGEMNRKILRYDFDVAEKKMEHLKNCLKKEESAANRQMVQRLENLLLYSKRKIDRAEYLKRQEELLLLTMPDYRQLLDKVYPFRNIEVQLLLNIANANAAEGNIERGIEIYYMLIRSLNCGYMGKADSQELISILTFSLAKRYGELGQHEKALNLCRNGIWRAKRQKYIDILPNLYAEMAWNMMQEIKNGKRNNEEEWCKKYLKQGYAAAVLSLQHSFAEIIEQYYKEEFGKEIFR